MTDSMTMIAATLHIVSADTLLQRASLKSKSKKQAFSGIFKEDLGVSLTDIQNARIAGFELDRAHPSRQTILAKAQF